MDTASIQCRLPVRRSTTTGEKLRIPARIYTEAEVERISISLREFGKHTWSENPRLYLVLRDIGQILHDDEQQLMDKLMGLGIRDSWLPMSGNLLKQICLPSSSRNPFCQAQKNICTLPSNIHLGNAGSHAHFAPGTTPPFESICAIGEGHIGKVDKVSCLTNQQMYARKTIRRDSSYLKRAQAHTHGFCSELLALRRIDHWHCVKLVRETPSGKFRLNCCK
jgi:hypothetical protein